MKEAAIIQTVSLKAVLLVQKIWSEASVNLEATMSIIKLHDHIILNLQRLWSHATIISFQTVLDTVTEFLSNRILQAFLRWFWTECIFILCTDWHFFFKVFSQNGLTILQRSPILIKHIMLTTILSYDLVLPVYPQCLLCKTTKSPIKMCSMIFYQF